ncbi:hypothetical protein QI260_05955 [Staphylococcus saprophyticus]|nr:hypothetical protein [Staphylococcus saprophyticus]
MHLNKYQLLKNDEPIALGSMTHCLDVFYWEIYYGCDHLAYNIIPFMQDSKVFQKAKAFDEIREIEIRSDITGYYDDTESYMYDVESVIEKYEEENSNDRK